MLYLQALDKGLEARAELADTAERVFLLNRAAGHAQLVLQHMGGQDLLIAPELAELHALVDDAVRAELLDEALELGVALVNLAAGHEARALVPVQVVPRDGVEGALALGNLYALAAREAAEAVPVGHDHGAAALDELGEIRVVYLAAGEDYPRAVGELRLRLALPYLLERLPEIGQDKIVRAGLAD